MNIKILGCSGGKTIERSPTSFIVDDRLLVDAGSVMNKLDTEELLNIEHLILTHSHFDHIADLPFLVLMYFEERKEDFHVYASDITTEWIFSHVLNGKIWPDLFEISSQNNGILFWNSFNHREEFKVGEYKVTSVPVNHTVPTNGFIIDDGNDSIAFTGDTFITDEFWKYCNDQKNLRALIIDVCLPNNMIDSAEIVLHLTPNTLSGELEKLEHKDITVFINHIKPALRDSVIDEIEEIDTSLDLIILEEDMIIDI